MGTLWSGPGKALEYHLDMFRAVERTKRWVDQHAGRKTTEWSMPGLLQQRLNLMTAMETGGLGAFPADGSSLAEMRKDPDYALRQANVERAVGLVSNEYQILNEGETHYVSHHIASSITEAAEHSYAEPLYETDIPARHGLIVFEHPLLINDLHPDTGKVVEGLTMPVRAIGWMLSNEIYIRGEGGKLYTEDEGYLPTSGIFYTLYTDVEAFETFYVASCNNLVPEDERNLAKTLEDARILRSWAIDTSAWAFKTPWSAGIDERPRDQYEIGQVHSNVAWMRRWLLAYFRWTFQRILVPTTYKPSKPELKRAARAGHPIDGHIKVLRLRREYEADQRGEKPESDPMRWSYQWIVRPHPRRQHYPSLGPARNEDGSFNPDSHRQIWIESYAKGNPMGPLVVGHNVTVSVR
jgi:hypothetical protein